MNLQDTIQLAVQKGMESLYQVQLETVELQSTRKEFEGEVTVVVFPMLRQIKGNPVAIGEALGAYLVENVQEIVRFNVVKGFLNLVITDQFYIHEFIGYQNNDTYGYETLDEKKGATVIEYSSPNTNKPLHLGHVRNNLLGYSVAEILKASGRKVYKTQIINDRGIHICKSMLAWQRYGEGKTPEDLDQKGDKLVGTYYVKFDQVYKKQIAELLKQNPKLTKEEAAAQAPLLLEAQEMLRKWEAGDEEVVALWKKMNQWVYDGFEETYKALGVDFDSYYYESNTYLLGKDVIEEGLEKEVFFKKKDGSVWIDLTAEGLDQKIVLRSDGTSVYMTQDIGTAIQRIKDHSDVDSMIYTVGNEQDYHFQVLFLILQKLGYSWASNLYHLSYGMVDLPSGKMKSREGTVVDADELVAEMIGTAAEISKDLGKLEGYTEAEKQNIYRIIGLGALKYFILKVDPKKRILFDPKASVDFQGNTGPFIQYTYARIQAIVRKASADQLEQSLVVNKLHHKEKEVLLQLRQFPEVIQQAAMQHSPALIANYTYELVKSYNSFFQNVSIFGADTDNETVFRIKLSECTGKVIKNAFATLGIEVPERM